MKVGGKNGLSRIQFRTLIMNLQEIARELKQVRQESEKMEESEDENKERK